MNIKKLKYRIGDAVKIDLMNEVFPVYEDVKEKTYRKLVRSKDNYNFSGSKEKEDIRTGQITGIKTFYEGFVDKAEITTMSSNYYYEDYDYDPGGIKVEKTIYLWCVRSGYLNKEHYFFEEDIKRFLNPPKIILTRPMFIPFKDTGWNTYNGEKVKKMMSEESKFWPRDKKGRFTK
jgi:hypothetical protein